MRKHIKFIICSVEGFIFWNMSTFSFEIYFFWNLKTCVRESERSFELWNLVLEFGAMFMLKSGFWNFMQISFLTYFDLNVFWWQNYYYIYNDARIENYEWNGW